MKKILIICLIFFLVAIGIGSYIIFMRPVTPTGPVDNGGVTAPFGEESGNASTTVNTSKGQITDNKVDIATLSHIFTEPAAGIVGIASKSGSTSAIRVTARADGHIYDVMLDTGNIRRVSNNSIYKIYESVWLPSGSTTIYRYINNSGSVVQTYSGKLIASTSLAALPDAPIATLLGTFLPENIGSIVPSPTGSRIFYIAPGQTDTQGVIANPDGSKKTAIFSSAILEWKATWPIESTITLTTKPASGINGILYFLDTRGNMKRILGGVPGLQTLTNPQASTVLISDQNEFLRLYDVKSGQSSILSLNTFTDKCVWSLKKKNTLYCAVPTELPSGIYPDNWYQGNISFSDEIYRINASTGTSTVIGRLKASYSRDLDVINPTLSPSEDYLMFMNKKDLSVWAYKLPQ
jgi:hypothetical protein